MDLTDPTQISSMDSQSVGRSTDKVDVSEMKVQFEMLLLEYQPDG